MNPPLLIFWIALTLVAAKWIAQMGLDRLNHTHTIRHRDSPPESLMAGLDSTAYGKSIDYTLAKSRLSQWEMSYDAIILIAVLSSGAAAWLFSTMETWFGTSAWSRAFILFLSGTVFSLLSIPFDWYSQFRMEDRFGFNTTTQKLWWSDRLKGFLLAFVLAYPLITLILKFVEWTGPAWWIWAWGTLVFYQLLMMILAPILILPLFNKFTALPDGTLRERLLELGSRTGFKAKSIQVMDGSRRSLHSNAFFTGFGRFRRIVLFDTLIEQLSEKELEAVLAHEIGHYKLNHIIKILFWSASSSFLGICAVAWLARQDWFYTAFGFAPGNVAAALLLFVLLSGAVTFWFAPLTNHWLRRFEYEADAYAATAIKTASPLINALRKLNEKNLSNLTPHPWYSRCYYSHPTLLEREQALRLTSREGDPDE